MNRKNRNTRILWLILFIVSCLFVCLLPYLFTKICITELVDCFSEFDMEFNATTGAIGDTIGGTMGPFIAIIAAIVTFAAFWVQYQFNLTQRKDIEKERIVNNFYELLHLFREYASNLELEIYDRQQTEKLKRKYSGYDTYHHLYGMFLVIYTAAKSIIMRSEAKEKAGSKDELDKFLAEYAYSYFFYGERLDLQINESNHHYELYNYLQKEMVKLEFDIIDARCADYCHNRLTLNQLESTYKLYINRSEDCEDEIHSDNYFVGFHNCLGSYFRRLYNLVYFIDNNEVFNESEKEIYVKMIRTQLSDYEQLLLYYNTFNKVGKQWNTKCDNEMGLISKYRLINNIPITAMVDPKPYTYYKENIEQWKRKGKEFFENNLTDDNTKNGLEEFINN